MDIPKSGAVVWDGELCTGCGTCELMCSLSHDGVTGPVRSRLQIAYHPFDDLVDSCLCRQCDSPACYLACPLADEALCVDGLSGARYVNEEACNGCGSCVEACPFEPSRIRLDGEKEVAFKCDLCRGREGGPVCVEYCDYGALRFVSREER